MKNHKKRGSMTLEACMVVPIFIILMLAVNGLFLMFMGQQILSHTVIQSAKSMAYDPYASQRVTANEGDKLSDMFVDLFSYANGEFTSPEDWYKDGSFFSVSQVAEDRFFAFLGKDASTADTLLELVGVRGGRSGLDFSECKVEDGVLTYKVLYTQEFPMSTADFTSFKRELAVQVKLFEYIQ